MIEPQLEELFQNTKPIDNNDEEAEQLLDLAGFQVTKAELFAHSREPAIQIQHGLFETFSRGYAHSAAYPSWAKAVNHPPHRSGCTRFFTVGKGRRRKRDFKQGYDMQNIRCEAIRTDGLGRQIPL